MKSWIYTVMVLLLVAFPAGVEAKRLASVDTQVYSSLISWIGKQGTKKLTREMLKRFVKERVKDRLKHVKIKDHAKRLASESDSVLRILEDPWWVQAVGFIPIAGDAFDLVHTPKQIKTALATADRLAHRLDRLLAIQDKPAAMLIRASLKRNKSWAGELDNTSYAEICKLADQGSDRAKQTKKLIEGEHRLMEKAGRKAR